MTTLWCISKRRTTSTDRTMWIPFCVPVANTGSMETWRDRARAEMKRRGVTQDTLSERLEMTQGGLQHWLAGTRQPSLEQINRIAAALDVSPAWLTHGVTPDSTLDGLGSAAQAALRRFISAERLHRAPATVWQSLHAIADLAFPSSQHASSEHPQGPLGAPINPEKQIELEALAQQAEEKNDQPPQRKRKRT